MSKLKTNPKFNFLCRKHQARDRHCERSEAISNAMTGFLSITQEIATALRASQ
jgi:hypothetical protein